MNKEGTEGSPGSLLGYQALSGKSRNRYYWGQHQRFFMSLLTAIKVDATVALAESALAESKCVVIGIQSTGDPSPCVWGVERRAEISGLGPLAGCFLALGSGLGLVGTASARR